MPRINTNIPTRYEIRAPHYEAIKPYLVLASSKSSGLEQLDRAIEQLEKTLENWPRK